MVSRQKSNILENDLQNVNRKIALPEYEVKRNNKILEEIVYDQIVPIMQEKSALYKSLYRDIFFGGSFFIGLKVGHPDEYDLVFLMQLPDWVETTLSLCSIPGFVEIQLEGMKQWEKRHKDYQFTSKLNSTKTSQSKVVQKRSKLIINESIHAVSGTKTNPNTVVQKGSKINTTRIEQSTVLQRRKPRPDNPKIRIRSPKMQKLWDNIKYNDNLPLTREQRIILSGLVNLLDDNYYFDTAKVSAWIEGIIKRTYNDIQQYGFIETSEGTLKAELSKSGPAFTLKLRRKSNRKPIMIDIDLVPGFVFSSKQWPPYPFRENPVPEKSEFFIVPKKPNKNGDFARCWRLSFEEQERVLIKDWQNFKPCIRLLKRLRDVGNHKSIVSYHIKTIFLWELEENEYLWSEPLADVFLTMLRKCIQIFEEGVILNYWNVKDNLIKGVSRKTLDDIANNLKKIFNDIKRHPDHVYRHLNSKNKRYH